MLPNRCLSDSRSAQESRSVPVYKDGHATGDSSIRIDTATVLIICVTRRALAARSRRSVLTSRRPDDPV
jgi:hypothetical protein